MATIESIRIVTQYQDTPDLSHLGEYSDTPAVEAYTVIDRSESPEWDENTYRYFNATNVDHRDQAKENHRRMEAYGSDEWHMVGVFTVAEVRVPWGKVSFHEQPFKTLGCWGVESDSSPKHFAEIAREELADLRTVLESFCVDLGNFDELADKAVAAMS